jgi:predicted CopG family antitoxin
MVSTIAVRNETLEMLKILKEEKKVKNFDELINQMIGNIKKPTKSFFGAIPSLGKFKREEIDRFT